MSQIITLNGKPLECEREPYLQVGYEPRQKTPIIINSKMVHGVNINGYDYPPALANSVLHYPGLPGQGSTIWDRSKEGNHGTITGAVWKRLPSGLWCLNFDGSSSTVSLGNPSSLQITTSLTIKFWGYVADYSSSLYAGISRWSNPYMLWEVIARYGRWRDFVLRESDGTVIVASPGLGGVDYPKWRHLVMSYDNGTWYVWKNAVEMDSQSVTHANIGTGGSISIGSRCDTPIYPYKGNLALFEIYNRGWTISDTQNSFNQERHLFGV